MSPDSRQDVALIPGMLPSQSRIEGLARHFIGLVIVGVLIGIACLPLNLVDRVQEQFYALMPTDASSPWTLPGILVALAPLVVMPVLLLLHAVHVRAAEPAHRAAERARASGTLVSSGSARTTALAFGASSSITRSPANAWRARRAHGAMHVDSAARR